MIIETPQKEFETKKTLFRFDQIIWYISGVIEVLLAFRFLFKLFGASTVSGFTRFIYTVSNPFVLPFQGIFNFGAEIIAAIVYLVITWGLVYLLELFFPITPLDVETK